MRARNDARQGLSALQRGIVLFCVLMLCVFIGILFFLSPKAYAQNGLHSLGSNVAVHRTRTVVPLPTITIILPPPTVTPSPTPLPTNTPTPSPTPSPTPLPTNTPTPLPTATPIPTPTATMAPTNTPIPTATTGPKATPTVGIKPTATTAAGILPPRTTPTPTPPILTVTGTPSSAGLPPGTTNAASSPTAGTNTTSNTAYRSAAITAQNNGKMLLPTAPELAIGSSVLGAAVLLGWYVWRRRQGSVLQAGYSAQAAQWRPTSPMSYDQTIQVRGNMGMVQEQGLRYQPDTLNQGTVPETPLPLQGLMSYTDTSLEAIMRQAQTGLFALPNKEEYF